MTTYFISDLHLDLSTPTMVQGFIHFVDSLRDAEALYILGDFFEAWIGDDVETPVSQAVSTALTRLSQSGCQVMIMHGNRDFLMGEDFCKQCGATLIPEGTVIKLGNEDALLTHGDDLCTDDVEYQNIRKLLRNPAWQQDILSKSVAERIEIAKQARTESKNSHSMKSDEIMDVNQTAVETAMQAASVTLMIHGHTHRPRDHVWTKDNQAYRRMVLGDWSDSYGWMIRFNPDEVGKHNPGLTLEQFPLA